MNASVAIINGRTFRPVIRDFFTVDGIVNDFRNAGTRADAIADVARIYGVDNRRAFLIARHFMNRTLRLRAILDADRRPVHHMV
jgi:hypothetical protein